MDFTREPVVETVITPKEGCKLVVRSSKGVGQEEYFVDAVEVVSFGNAFFFRSLEKPKSFLLPVIDYEVLEVREARMVLKHVGADRSIKIGGGRQKESAKEQGPKESKKEEPKPEKKRERKRHYRRRRTSKSPDNPESKVELPVPSEDLSDTTSPAAKRESASSIIRSLLAPPPLISETIGQYRESFSQAFYEKGQGEELVPQEDAHIEAFEEDTSNEKQEEVFSPLHDQEESEPKEKSHEVTIPPSHFQEVESEEDLWDFSENTPH